MHLLMIILFVLSLQNKAQTVSDADDNTYNTVTIGTQTWMKENLKTTKFKDGTSIPNITNASVWSTLTSSSYRNYNNTIDIDTINIYGRLYNWYTINTGKLCPTGWHVPDSSELIALVTYLGGQNVAGGKLKESGLTHWDPNTGADNSSGFTALPSGIGYPLGGFYGLSKCFYIWSSSDMTNVINSFDIAYSISLSGSDYVEMGKMNDLIKNAGLSVRCLKDGNVISVPIIGNQARNYFYPNPAKDKMFIRYNKQPTANIMVFDLQGKQVAIQQTSSSDYIDISNLPKGIYVVKIIDLGNTIVEKLIKE
jgi:uncharacterized protein (TIGR02145 family)